MTYTTIGVYEQTKTELDEIKLCPTETYDHLLQRIIKNIKEKITNE